MRVAFIAPGVAVVVAAVFMEGTGLFVCQMVGTRGKGRAAGNILLLFLSLVTKGVGPCFNPQGNRFFKDTTGIMDEH